MVLQARPNYLFAVVEIFGADEADDGIDQQGLEGAREAVGAGLERLLVGVVVRAGGERASLARLEIHEIGADAPAPERRPRVEPLAERGHVYAEALVHLLCSSDGLKDQVHRHALLDGFYRRGDVGEHAALRRYGEARDDAVEEAQELRNRAVIVRGGIDTDDRVAAAVEEAVHDLRGDRPGVVDRVVRLKAHREPPRKADGVPERGDVPNLRGGADEVLVSHELGDGRGHLGQDAGGDPFERVARGLVEEEPVAELAHGERGDFGEGVPVVRVEDEARDLVLVVRDDLLAQEVREVRVGERHLRGRALPGAFRGDTGEQISRTSGRGLRQQVLQRGERVCPRAYGFLV